MRNQRTRVTHPEDVDVDHVTHLAREEAQRRRQREALSAAIGAWKDEDHPELHDGAAAWVRKMRADTERCQRG